MCRQLSATYTRIVLLTIQNIINLEISYVYILVKPSFLKPYYRLTREAFCIYITELTFYQNSYEFNTNGNLLLGIKSVQIYQFASHLL